MSPGARGKSEKPAPPQGGPGPERPDIFRYHDYREFLKDWFDFLKKMQPGFSLRMLAQQAELASGYLPMVLSGKRPLSAKALAKLALVLGFPKAERSYLEALVSLGTSDSQDARLEALERMKRFQSYRKLNPKEIEVYQYLTRWHYVAIREMAALPEFKADAAWIRERLKGRVSLKEIKEALEFLVQNGYLELRADGSVTPPDKNLDCLGGVYRVALAEFHREMFQLASDSIESTPSAERSIQGHTFALDEKGFDRAREILNEALSKIRALEEEGSGTDTVYHAELALFPLTTSDRRRNGK
ncbi:MAG: TIGR02147 family protein [Oligoflexia bacterium]|nr:TIGR02147 family protein [Oligoflexia bacterium]